MLDCKQRNFFRHGDVLIRETDNVMTNWFSESPKPLVSKQHVIENRPLAYGEKTGHAHTVKNGEVTFYEKDGTLYMQVDSDNATITHQEHPDLEVPKGFYEVRTQQEYLPSQERSVVD